MSAQVDLRQLVIERGGSPAKAGRPPRHLVSRYLVPAAMLFAFALMMLWVARDSLLPSTPVTVVPVVVARAEVQQAGVPAFQAAGWVEPRPTSVLVPALAEGVIERLLVVEGQPVRAGEPVAQLIDTDARNALDRAQADLSLRDAELASTRAELAAAQLRLNQPVHLEAALAEADSLLAQAETDLAKLPFETRAAGARARLAEEDLAGKRAAGAAVAERLVQRARGELESASAQWEELKQRRPHLERVAATLRQKRAALAKQLELKIDEARQLADAESKVKAGDARLRQAQLAVDAARLNLERTVVRSPVAGRVLKLLASPGARLAGRSASAAQDSGNVLSLYDPEQLQVRVDVRLEDVAQVQPGQRVRVETASAPGPIDGEVLFATSAANVQKNTLEVKVALKSPPPTIRPEMLVQATFFAVGQSESPKQAAARQRLLVPRQLVEKTEQGAAVWVADAAGTARRKIVKPGGAVWADLIEVVEGLYPTDKLISGGRESLSDGQRIRIAGEDQNLGITPAGMEPGK